MTDTKQELVFKLMKIVFDKHMVDPEVYPLQFQRQKYFITQHLEKYKREYAEQLAVFEIPKLENSSAGDVQ